MALLYLTQSSNEELDLSTDGNTDTLEMNFLHDAGKDFQIVRTTGTGQPIITFKISNDGINFDNWELEDETFSDSSQMIIFCKTKHTKFRMYWLSNGSTGTMTANFNVL